MQVPFLGSARAIASSTAGNGIASLNLSPQECINFFIEEVPDGEMQSAAFVPVPGATSWTTLANTSQIRGMIHYAYNGLLYVVSGDDFYEVSNTPTATDRGDMATSTGLVQMALNYATGEIVIVDGNTGKHFATTTNTFGTISDVDFPDTATCVFHLNGRFVANDPGSGGGRFAWSALNDGTTWDTTDVATCESIGSEIIAMIEDRGTMWFLGEIAGELWYQPEVETDLGIYARFEKINIGCAARMSLQKFDNSVAWLTRTQSGQFNVVRAGANYQPEVISTPEISRKLEEVSDSSVVDAYAWTYTIGGHEFYVLTVPNAFTVAYDARTKLWHQMSGAFTNSLPTQFPVSCIAGNITVSGVPGRLVVGDYNATGKIWYLKMNEYQWDSVNMPRRITGPLMHTPNESKLRFSEVQVDIEEGVLTGSETGDDGQLTFSYSKNGGHTYSTGNQLSLGSSRTHRLIKRKLGWGRLWNFRIYTDTPRKIIVKGAYGRVYGESLVGVNSASKK